MNRTLWIQPTQFRDERAQDLRQRAAALLRGLKQRISGGKVIRAENHQVVILRTNGAFVIFKGDLIIFRVNQANPFGAGAVSMEIDHDFFRGLGGTHDHIRTHGELVLAVEGSEAEDVALVPYYPTLIFLAILPVDQGDPDML